MSLTVAILGNHTVPYCTESELDWTFEHLGHRVIRLQENTTTTQDIYAGCVENNIDLFLYIHTHGWITPGYESMDKIIAMLKTIPIMTASFHLDRYWGLNTFDSRQDRIGEHPFWHTDYVFTADGGNQGRFQERGIKHIWLPPAVVERGCYPGNYNPELAVDVAFVGARSYHPEYPFRPFLIDWLAQTYGPRFKRFAGDTTGTVREQRLNDLYASAKVIVGDSCFAGAPFYWSDRVPETLGRHGFLIHPEVEGLDIPGLVTFKTQNLTELKEKIDWYVDDQAARQASILTSSADVLQNHTYTQRVSTMLKTIGLA